MACTKSSQSADETGLFFNLQPNKTIAFQDFCRCTIKSKEWASVLLACNADGCDKLPLLVTGKYDHQNSDSVIIECD
jgi:hypothetical protein